NVRFRRDGRTAEGRKHQFVPLPATAANRLKQSACRGSGADSIDAGIPTAKCRVNCSTNSVVTSFTLLLSSNMEDLTAGADISDLIVCLLGRALAPTSISGLGGFVR